MAQIGNTNAAKARKFYDAMMKAAAEDDWSKLRRIADKTLAMAEAGEAWAVQTVRDTLDGKPAQTVTVAGDPENPLLLALDASDRLSTKLR